MLFVYLLDYRSDMESFLLCFRTFYGGSRTKRDDEAYISIPASNISDDELVSDQDSDHDFYDDSIISETVEEILLPSSSSDDLLLLLLLSLELVKNTIAIQHSKIK